jgi:hypothetical protein
VALRTLLKKLLKNPPNTFLRSPATSEFKKNTAVLHPGLLLRKEIKKGALLLKKVLKNTWVAQIM